MGYRSLRACVADLERAGQLVRLEQEIDPYLEAAEVHRRVHRAGRPGWRHSNLGMYRVQLSGNAYEPGRQVGLHYQIQRGIGAHHAAALARGVPFRVNVFVGGPPALALAAVMPLPEGLPEVAFAGALGGRRVRLVALTDAGALPLPALAADADFCITGTVDPERQLPEGPFGDH